MQGDHALTPESASHLHAFQTRIGVLVIWCIAWNTHDYPWQASARPTLLLDDRIVVSRSVLVADSVDAVRDMLPCGLRRYERHEVDDPAFVEVWL